MNNELKTLLEKSREAARRLNLVDDEQINAVLNAVADAQRKMFVDIDTQRVAYKKYRKEGLTRKEAKERYLAELAAAEEAAKKQAEEEKANEVTDLKLLAEIRDLLKQKNCAEIKPADKETEKA